MLSLSSLTRETTTQQYGSHRFYYFMGRDVRQRNKLIASAVDQHLLVLISGHAESLCSQSAENPQFFPCQSIPFTDRSVVPSASQHLRDSAVVILLPTLDPDVLLKDLVGQRFARPRAE